jgi:cell division protein ZapA (FtsZ GTPase activity inhibitor)
VPEFNSSKDGWNKRLNLFSGRSLSDLALQAEQNNRSGHLALLGQLRSAGVISGLQVTEAADIDNKLGIQIATGQGICASGEDVWVPRPLTVSLPGLPVFLNQDPYSSLGAFLASGRLPALRTFILVLQPIVLLNTGSADPNRCTDWDDSSQAFENEQRTDGVRLALYAWDSGIEPELEQSRWRNQLANAIFTQELRGQPKHPSPEHPDPQPWKRQGLPIALIALTADRQEIEFMDGFAVVRTGGRPRPVTPVVPNSGDPVIWQARLQQFAEQLAELEPQGKTLAEQQNWIQTEVAPRFRFLPPVGLLPAAALDPQAPRESQNYFFPATYAWQVAPIPLEQLELVLKDSASLAPFDLDQADQVQVWVPVPQAWFEPNLLLEEKPNQLFQQRIVEFQNRRAEWLARRGWLRQRATAIALSLNGQALSFPDPDPNQLEQPEEGTVPPLDPPELDYQTELRDGVRVVLPIQALRQTLLSQTPIDNDVVKVTNWPVGNPITPPLSNKVSYNASTELITVNGILSETERDQLISLSPVNGNAIVDLWSRSKDNTDLNILDQKGLQEFINFLESKVARADDAVEFGFLQSRTNMYRIRQQVLGQADASRLATSSTLADIATRESAYATQKDLSAYFLAAKARQVAAPEPAPAPATRAAAGIAAAAAAIPAADSEAFLLRDRAVGLQNMTTASSGFAIGGTATAMPRFDIGKVSGTSLQFGSGIETSIRKDLLAQPQGIELQSSVNDKLKISRLFESPFTNIDVIEQSPIIGRSPASVIVGERLKQPAAIETRDFSLAGRQNVVENLALLGIFKDLPVPGAALNFGQVKPGTLPPEPIDEKALPKNADEVEYFSRAVHALDLTVAALRLGEGRIQAYRGAIALCRKTMDELLALQGQINQRLRVVETELAEARQDVSVAKALLAEETARVERINERRQRILSEHVTFLAYQRPRSVNLLLTPPWRSLDPGFVADPLPPCLNDSHPIPRELRAMTDLLREAPLGWFSSLPQSLDRIDRVDSLVRLFDSAMQRINSGVGSAVDVATITTGSTQISQTIRGIYGQSLQVVQQHRRLIARLDLNAIAAQSWRQSRQQAEKILTLGDLLDGNHRRPELSNQAATLLEQLSRVATCLHARFAEVKPILRLDWAERLSQFDEPVNLRALSNLPRWGEIEVQDRRELQSLVDWLFQQFNSIQADSIYFGSDLVRLSLLLACHAPVNQIISGRVLKPTTVRPDGRLQISMDPLQVRIGMSVLVYSNSNTVVARGIVDDLNGGLAIAKITQTTQVNLALSETTRVQFLRQSPF